MVRKWLSAALAIAIAALTGSAANGDNVLPVSGENKSSPSVNPSYYEGVWVGAWPGWRSASISQEITIKVMRGDEEGIYLVEYSWGAAPADSGFYPMPGSRKLKGREEGDQLVFEWKNKEGRNFKITLKKQEDMKVKARIDKSGPTGSNERPYNETYLRRK